MRRAWVLAALVFAMPGVRAESNPYIGLHADLWYPVVESGESVHVRLRNESVWQDVKYQVTFFEDRDPLHSESGLLYPSNENINIFWDQTDENHLQVNPGVYRVVIEFYKYETLQNLVEYEFEIVPRHDGSVIFQTTKSLYIRGEQVRFYLINKGQNPLILQSSDPWRVWYLFWPETFLLPETLLPVFTPSSSQKVEIVEGDGAGRRRWSWNQINNRGHVVGAGNYYVYLYYQEMNTQKREVRAALTVR